MRRVPLRSQRVYRLERPSRRRSPLRQVRLFLRRRGGQLAALVRQHPADLLLLDVTQV